MDDAIRDMIEFQKSMGIECDAHENTNLSEHGMLAIEAERKKRNKKDGDELEEIKEDEEEEKKGEDDEAEEEPVARPGPGQKRIIAPYWDLSGKPEDMPHQQMQDEIQAAMVSMMDSIKEEVADLEEKLAIEAGRSSVAPSDSASMISGVSGFLPLKAGSSTASSVVKGIGYTPSHTTNSFISSGSSKGLLSLTKSKADRREDR